MKKKTEKIVIYIMLFAMIASFVISLVFVNR
ncbi:MAG: stressosome-associated protein Prli42 [Clostridium sp.]|nr:stressosome-associated protein Prli42 [Clostridium sp.]MCM1443993.1 stressosome-associated protein Prli42 [Candidatus Amulumruptor caecigallinarius]